MCMPILASICGHIVWPVPTNISTSYHPSMPKSEHVPLGTQVSVSPSMSTSMYNYTLCSGSLCTPILACLCVQLGVCTYHYSASIQSSILPPIHAHVPHVSVGASSTPGPTGVSTSTHHLPAHVSCSHPVHPTRSVSTALRFWTCHDARFLYMLMEYVPGGELFSYLRSRGRFPATSGLFYSAEIVCALQYLHSRDIVYRDLKPENILLDREGHIKLTDFGFAKKLVDRTWTLCGTPEYLAPEVIQSKGHGRAVDWWALGILVFEMLSGFPPFFDDNPFGIYQKILAGRIDFPRHLDFSAKDLIKKLLVVDRTRRLGNMKNGAEDVKRHRWFRAVDWDSVPQRKLKPPIVPKLSGDGDTSNFETYPENDWDPAPPVTEKDLEIFKNF
ncbi:Serine/threonine-protein kinase PRKX [Heterocephalus glaber]|uniref:Serine/threonine-protein kinase PRKX n=1 Tax=Heterocephalus glaber TaxID=10181 RepID=G5BQR8_HETGA|nr:Serine/threonine-protein kinase PRKX [Heterocephalus glaber]